LIITKTFFSLFLVELNSIYLRYRSYQPKINNIYENYSLTYLQLWKLLEDCEISKLTNYTLGKLILKILLIIS